MLFCRSRPEASFPETRARGRLRRAAHAGAGRRRRGRSRAAVERAGRAGGVRAVDDVLAAAVRKVLATLAGVGAGTRVRRAAGLRRVVADAVLAATTSRSAPARVVERSAFEHREVRARLGRAGRTADAVRVADLTVRAVTALHREAGAGARDCAAGLSLNLALVRGLLRITTVRDAANTATLTVLAAVTRDGIAVHGATAAVRDDAALEAFFAFAASQSSCADFGNARRLARVEDAVALAGAAVGVGRAAAAVGVVPGLSSPQPSHARPHSIPNPGR